MNKKITIFSLSIIALIAAMISACEKKVGKAPSTTTSTSTTGATTTGTTAVNACDTITYTKHIKPLYDIHCVSCHNSNPSSGWNLSTYDKMKEKGEQGKIDARVVKGLPPGPMPQGGLLPQAQRDLFTCWISNGYKQ